MTTKANSTETFTATHENGAAWRLSVNAKRGVEFADKCAKNFARNYCRKHRIPGRVILVSEADFREVIADVTEAYTIK